METKTETQNEMITMTLEDFLKEASKRFGSDARKWKFKCPHCETIQSAEDFALLDEFKDTKEDIDSYVGFSCIGRFGSPKGCNWTLGGLFQIHRLEIVTEDGKKHPRFELAEA